jgi:hypothetical protein
MSAPAQPSALLPLVEKLKACPAHDKSLSQEMLHRAWERCRAWQPEDEVTPAVMAGVILQDEPFARLLNEAERTQMAALARVALERYQQRNNPPNKLGKIIAAALKEFT